MNPQPPRIAYFFFRMRSDVYVKELCIANASDPDQWVETLAPNGTHQRWRKRAEGDLLVFHPPDGYDGNQGLLWHYNRFLQRGEALPREEADRLALCNRHSVYITPSPTTV